METSKSLKNKYGQVILSSNGLRELLLQGKNISHTTVIADEEIELYNKYQDHLLKQKVIFSDPPSEDMEFDEFQYARSEEWLIPKEYQDIDVLTWLLDKCSNQEEIDRVHTEYVLFEERDLTMLLRFFIYLVDYMRAKKFIWGVGRGSSVASYILFLIGVHRVNSIKYNLSITEYLK